MEGWEPTTADAAGNWRTQDSTDWLAWRRLKRQLRHFRRLDVRVHTAPFLCRDMSVLMKADTGPNHSLVLGKIFSGWKRQARLFPLHFRCRTLN